MARSTGLQLTNVLRRSTLARPSLQPAKFATHRRRATTTTKSSNSAIPSRRAVTVVNDTGRIPWSDLSVGEKAARTTQQSFNLGVIGLGLVMTLGVSYVLYLEVFSTESKTAVFNRAVTRVRKDERCVDLLAGRGHSGKIEAHGEASWSRWARNRFISSTQETDKVGVTHMHMHFYVTGPKDKGTVVVHMVKGKNESSFRYYTLALDVAGHERVWIENAESGKLDKRGQGKMFGVKWW